MKRMIVLLLAGALAIGCGKKKADAAGDAGTTTGGDTGPAGSAAAAKAMLGGLIAAGADQAALSAALRPKPEDYAAVFAAEAGQTVKTWAEPLWDAGKMQLKPTAEQTEIQIAGATQAELAKGDGSALHCPATYKDIADKIQPSVVVYCFRFVKPGEKGGLHADGLVWVNGHWALFPKPYRAFKS